MRIANITMRGSAGEDGFVLPTAILVLFILAALAGTAISLATQTSTSTSRDNNTKSALEAAEAGLRVASYRLSTLKPTESNCISGKAVVGPTLGYCEDPLPAESLGNGATFQYWTTPALKATEKCAGQVVAIKAGITVRCVTSEGRANGISQRLAARVESAASNLLFPIKGFIGLEEVLVSGSAKVPSLVGSNGTIKIKGGAELNGGYELGPKGKFVREGGAKVSPPEKTRTEAEGPIVAQLPANHVTAATSEDSRIGVEDPFFTEGKAANKFTGPPNYELTLSSNSKLTLGGSKYYFCNFEANHAGKLIIAPGAHVEIFIDAPPPEDPESKCPAGTGKFNTEEFTLENNAYNPAALLIEMAGKGPVTLGNGGALEATHPFEATIYAPEATVEVSGAKTFKGGILGKKVNLGSGASLFEWSEEVGSLTNGSLTAYSRKAWEQCAPGTGAKEGC